MRLTDEVHRLDLLVLIIATADLRFFFHTISGKQIVKSGFFSLDMIFQFLRP